MPIFYEIRRVNLISYKQAITQYGEENLCKIVNPKQVLTYLKHGCHPIAYMIGYDDKDVFVFLRSETSNLYELWKKHELK